MDFSRTQQVVAQQVRGTLRRLIQPVLRVGADKFRTPAVWFYGQRRKLATLVVIGLTGWIFVHVMFGPNGMVIYREKRAQIQSLQAEINAIERENDRYATQIQALTNDPKMIEKEAREQLNYTRQGEVVYVLPP
ncbi:MAG: septum formation initiator family protein, partial [Acidobacteriales bacterium]|nr:septum formation initiator family protein [Terriglobales bacterium]